MATFLQWNVRGIRANLEDLNILLDKKPVAVSLQETLLSQDSSISLNNYNTLNKFSSASGGRGVSLSIRKDILFQPIPLNTSLEAVAARISLDRAITVCSLYLSPSTVVSKSALEDLVFQLPNPLVIMGDLNGHSPLWGGDRSNPQGKILEDLCSQHDLVVLNDGSPTFISASSGSLSALDISICDPSLFLNLEWSVHDDTGGSDHFPTIITYSNNFCETPLENWRFRQANWELYAASVDLKLSSNSTISVDDFTQALITSAKEHIPISKCKITSSRKAWFDEECKAYQKKRKAAQRNVFRNPTQQNVINFKKLRAKCRYVFKTKRRNSWKHFCSGINFKTSPGKVWKIIRKLKGTYSSSSIRCLEKDNKIITSKPEVANILADTFQENSSTAHYSNFFQDLKSRKEKQNLNFESDNLEEYNSSFTLAELKDALLKSNSSAPGPDNIHYNLLTHLSERALSTLLELFNGIWLGGPFPPSWHEATIVPIPKPGKDHSNPNNYRPIALTSCLCKTMERMVYERLLWQLELTNSLAFTQCGFRKHHSTVDHLVRFESFIRDSFISSGHAVAILFDLEKAYDTTWKYGILSDLHDLGLRGNLPVFIEKFLQDRLFRVRVGSTFSDPHEQEMGVPQGSILSPLLFNIKINNIVQSVKQGVDNSLFVDDFMLCARGKTLAGVERQLQLCVNAVQEWVNRNGFKFSITKTECIHFCKKRGIVADPNITLNGSAIKSSSTVKFLGITFDQKLSFLPHLKNLKKDCSNALNILRVISHSDWGSDKNTMLHLYRSLIRSKLDYGCIVYGSARPSYLKILDPIVHQGLRIALGAFRTSPVQSLYVEANEPPLSLRRTRLAMCYYIKLKSHPENPAYPQVVEPSFIEKYRAKPEVIPPFGIRVLEHLNKANIDPDLICDDPLYTSTCPWNLVPPTINWSLTKYKKNSNSPDLFKQLFLEQAEKYSNFEHIYTDGSLQAEAVAAAAVVPHHTKKSLQHRMPDGCSVYTAELKAILLALRCIYQSKRKKFLIVSDSLSSLEALSTRKITHPFLSDIHDLHTSLINDGKSIVFMWVPSHMGIRGNVMADQAAKEALKHEISKVPAQFIPPEDLKRRVKVYVDLAWQDIWNEQSENKLFSARPLISEFLLCDTKNRREEAVLSRLHIGHSKLTHSCKFDCTDPPWCHSCDTLYTIKHILLDCVDLIDIRCKYFISGSLKDLFTNTSAQILFAFLKEINIFHRL
jgi:ribonuclease HI